MLIINILTSEDAMLGYQLWNASINCRLFTIEFATRYL